MANFTQAELNAYLATLNTDDSSIINTLNRVILLNQTVFQSLFEKLITGVKHISDLSNLPEINDYNVSYFLDGNTTDQLSSAAAKYENMIRLGLDTYINSKVVPFNEYSVRRYRTNDDFTIFPNISGGLRNNESDKFFNSFSELNNIYKSKMLLLDPTKIVEADLLITDLETFSSATSNALWSKFISEFINEINYTKSNIIFPDRINPSHLNGFALRGLENIRFINPTKLKEALDLILKYSTSVNNQTIDGFTMLYNATSFDSLTVKDMERYSFVVAVKYYLKLFYSSFYEEVGLNDLAHLKIVEVNSFITRYASFLNYSKLVYTAVVVGDLEW
jgi:hypothetical protein